MRIDEYGVTYPNGIVSERGECIVGSKLTEHGWILNGQQYIKNFTQSIVMHMGFSKGFGKTFVQTIKTHMGFVKQPTRKFTQSIVTHMGFTKGVTRKFTQSVVFHMGLLHGKYLFFTQAIKVRQNQFKTVKRTLLQNIVTHMSMKRTINKNPFVQSIKLHISVAKTPIKNFIQAIKLHMNFFETTQRIIYMYFVQPVMFKMKVAHGKYYVFVQKIVVRQSMSWTKKLRHTAEQTVITLEKKATQIETLRKYLTKIKIGD